MIVVELVVILLAGAVGGILARAVRIPAVAGQMVAGVAVGPLLLGAAAPAASARIFPAGHASTIHAISTATAVAFLFTVSAARHTAPGIRQRDIAGIGVGNALVAVGAAFCLWPVLDRATDGQASIGTICLLGVALTVCALPVMAQIIAAKDIGSTRPARLGARGRSTDRRLRLVDRHVARGTARQQRRAHPAHRHAHRRGRRRRLAAAATDDRGVGTRGQRGRRRRGGAAVRGDRTARGEGGTA